MITQEILFIPRIKTQSMFFPSYLAAQGYQLRSTSPFPTKLETGIYPMELSNTQFKENLRITVAL